MNRRGFLGSIAAAAAVAPLVKPEPLAYLAAGSRFSHPPVEIITNGPPVTFEWTDADFKPYYDGWRAILEADADEFDRKMLKVIRNL